MHQLHLLQFTKPEYFILPVQKKKKKKYTAHKKLGILVLSGEIYGKCKILPWLCHESRALGRNNRCKPNKTWLCLNVSCPPASVRDLHFLQTWIQQKISGIRWVEVFRVVTLHPRSSLAWGLSTSRGVETMTQQTRSRLVNSRGRLCQAGFSINVTKKLDILYFLWVVYIKILRSDHVPIGWNRFLQMAMRNESC